MPSPRSPPAATFRYRAFISYSHQDSRWAEWLQRALETYAVPARLVGLTTEAGVIPARLVPIFRDRDELPSATDLSREVNDVLAQSDCLIVICSPHSAQSHWVDQEVRAFQRLGRAHRIFCVIVDGEPGASALPGREHDECFTPALRQRLDESGAPTGEHFEPIAADARPHRDGKTNVRLKLIAGMLGIDLDDLKHRERRRRRWRLTAVAVAGVALLTLTSALAVNAIIARHAAERRQQQAEDLVGYMLGDLDNELRKVNRLDILESVADKAVKYFDALPTADMSDEALAQRAKALQKIGHVRLDQGRMSDAESAFTAAQKISDKLARHAPGRADYAVLDAENLSWLGRILWTRADFDAALIKFRAGRDRLDRLARAQLDESAVMHLSATLHTNIGRVLEARGDLDAARAEYASVLQTFETLSAREPDRLDWKSEVGYAHNNLGQLAWKKGDLGEAIRAYAADRRIKVSLQTLEPGSNARREDLLISNAILGNNLLSAGALEPAEKYLRAAVADSETLLAQDASVTGWREDAGYFGTKLAGLYRMRGDESNAIRVGERSLAQLRGLVSQDPANVVWARELSEGEIEAARRLLARHRIVDAEKVIKTAKDRISKLQDKDVSDRATALTMVRAWIATGDVAAARDDANTAHREWLFAEKNTRNLGTSSSDPSWLDARATALLRLHKVAQARSLVVRLSDMGYQHPDFIASAQEQALDVKSDAEVEAKIAGAVTNLEND